MSFQPPPTWALPVAVDETTGKASFNPIWLKWFVDLASVLNKSGVSSTGTLAHNSLGGLQGGITAERYHLNFAEYTRVTGGIIGTVTDVSVVTANGFAGTVVASTTTPAITLTTTLTGLLKGNGTAMSAAAAGTDYALPSQTFFLGTTSIAINRASAALALAGITSIDGSAAKWTTARNLAGNSVDGSANVAFANKFIVQGTADTGLSAAQFLGALGTGIVKNTTTTGVLSIAIAGDFPTLNQSTTGSAATLTTPRAINGVNFDGSAAITVTAAAGTLTGTTLNSTVVTSSLTSVGTLGATQITTSGASRTLTVTDTGTSGGNLHIEGDGATTPNKTIRAKGGLLEFVNSAYAAVIASLSDTGGWITAGVVKAFSGTAVSAGGAAGVGLLISSTTNLGFFVGSGAPTLAAAKGSLYVNTTATTTTTRLYINTDGSTTWTNFTSAA